MVNTKIRLIIFFADKDGEALYSQQKQDQELTVTPQMSYGKHPKVENCSSDFQIPTNSSYFDRRTAFGNITYLLA